MNELNELDLLRALWRDVLAVTRLHEMCDEETCVAIHDVRGLVDKYAPLLGKAYVDGN